MSCTPCNCHSSHEFDHAIAPSLKTIAYIDHKQREWDEFFLGMAKAYSKKSKDPGAQVGSIAVRPDHTTASWGFNGFAKKMPDVIEHYRNRDKKLEDMIHAEMNVIILAREPLDGCTLYVYPFAPCHRCMPHVIQAGFERIVAPKLTERNSPNWSESIAKSREQARVCGVRLDEVDYYE